MPRHKADTDTRRAKVLALLLDGNSRRVIADKLGVHRNTITTDIAALRADGALDPVPDLGDERREWLGKIKADLNALRQRYTDGIDEIPPAQAANIFIRLWPEYAALAGLDTAAEQSEAERIGAAIRGEDVALSQEAANGETQETQSGGANRDAAS